MTNTSSIAAAPRRTNRPRRCGADAADPAADAAAPAAAAGRVLAPFVPSKPHSCADCEACRLRKDIAATQAAIVAAWQRQDELAAGQVGIADVARVPLPDAALEALLRAVIEDALAPGPASLQANPAQLCVLPLATVKHAADHGVLKGTGASFEDALRGGRGHGRPRVHLVAVAHDAHLRELMERGGGGGSGGAETPESSLSAVAPSALYAVLMELLPMSGGGGHRWIAAGVFGPGASSFALRADGITSPPWWGSAKRDGGAAAVSAAGPRKNKKPKRAPAAAAASTSSAATAEALALMLLPPDVAGAVAEAAVVAARAECLRSVRRLFV